LWWLLVNWSDRLWSILLDWLLNDSLNWLLLDGSDVLLALSLLGNGSSAWSSGLLGGSDDWSDFFSHGVGSTLLDSSGDLSVSSWSSDGVLWVNIEGVLGLWGEELSVVLLLDGLLLLENVLLLLSDEEGFSRVSHVLEFKVDLSDLLIRKAVSWSVNQILDGSKLVDEDEIVVVSGVVDGIEIGV
jgi:hypothetical protein